MPHFCSHLPEDKSFSLEQAFLAIQLLKFQVANRDRSLSYEDLWNHYQLREDMEFADIVKVVHTTPAVMPSAAREARDQQLDAEIAELDAMLAALGAERAEVLEKGTREIKRLEGTLTSSTLNQIKTVRENLQKELCALDSHAAEMQVRLEDALGGRGAKPLVGFDAFLDKLIICLLVQRNALLEGNPGLAKTLVVKTLADMLGLCFSRIQFTPDLVPSDFIASYEVVFSDDGKIRQRWRPGPVFANLVLCDEVNRASPRAQSALVEVAEERQATPISSGGASRLIRPIHPINEARLLVEHGAYFGERRANGPNDKRIQCFIVLCTLNPIESEGTYPVSDAVLDRFAFKLLLDYPKFPQLTALSEHAFEPHNVAEDETSGAPPRKEYPSGQFVEDDADPGRVLELGHHRKASAEDAVKTTYFINQLREKDHVKALYFLVRLRKMILGPRILSAWKSPENEHLRQRLELLLDFTHAQPTARGEDEETGLGGGVERAGRSHKNEELKALLSEWQNSTDANSVLKFFGLRLSDMLQQPSYPQAENGSSPRGLLSLVRTIHAAAFQQRGSRQPTWADIVWLAPDCLRHRVRLTRSAQAFGATPEMLIEELLSCLTD